jgi:SulP family sulfate permease
MAILLFIRDQVHGSVIRHKRYLNEVSSKTRRLSAERNLLRRYGDQGVLCELQGNLFFGTTDQLLSHLEADLRTRQFVLLDLRRVQSLDYTAAHLFEQMQSMLAERGGQLLFSGMPSALPHQQDFARYLVEVGLVQDGRGVMIAETLDSALEWMEEQILQAAGAPPKDDEQPLELNEIDLFRGLDPSLLARLAPCLRPLRLAAGEKAFSHGDRADEIFLIRQGSVRIMLPLEHGRRHHLATIGRGDFFGELSFLDRGVRSADVEAKVPTELFALSRARFDEWIHADSVFGVEVFSRLALSIAERLRHTDLELRSLEER